MSDLVPVRRRFRSIQHRLAFNIGALGMLLGTASGVFFSLKDEKTLNEWVLDAFTSGAGVFWITSVWFAFWIFWCAWQKTVSTESTYQYLLFFMAIVVMAGAHQIKDSSLGLVVLSWATFFILDDWILIEHFVVKKNARLELSHFLRIAVFNVVIFVSILATLYSVADYINDKTAGEKVSPWMIVVPFGSGVFIILALSLFRLRRIQTRQLPSESL